MGGMSDICIRCKFNVHAKLSTQFKRSNSPMWWRLYVRRWGSLVGVGVVMVVMNMVMVVVVVVMMVVVVVVVVMNMMMVAEVGSYVRGYVEVPC